MIHEIYIIDDENELINSLCKSFEKFQEYRFINIQNKELELALKNIPSLFIINEDNIHDGSSAFDICSKIRSNDDNKITPIIVTSSNNDKQHRIEILGKSVQYYIKKPIDEKYMFFTIKNLVDLLYTNRKVSPLTGLPGNVQIQAEMKKRLHNNETFAILYVDLDNFKAYNDVYGFSNGDEIIKLTSQIIVKYAHEIEDGFVGHIGGDDFVAIISQTDYDKICQEIIIEFDTEVIKFYTQNDALQGFVEIENRRGIMEQFPIMTISVAVVEVEPGMYKSTLEIGEVGAQVKHMAKTIMGSTYVVNRRKNTK